MWSQRSESFQDFHAAATPHVRDIIGLLSGHPRFTVYKWDLPSVQLHSRACFSLCVSKFFKPMQSSLSSALLILSVLVAASLASSVPNARRDAASLVPRQASSPDALATERALAFAQKYSPSDLLVSSPAVPVASSVSRRAAMAKRQDSSLSPEALAIESARVFAEKYSPNDVRNATTTDEAVERRGVVEASPDALAVERARAFAERYSPNDVAA